MTIQGKGEMENEQNRKYRKSDCTGYQETRQETGATREGTGHLHSLNER